MQWSPRQATHSAPHSYLPAWGTIIIIIILIPARSLLLARTRALGLILTLSLALALAPALCLLQGRAADSAGAASRGGSPGKPESQWHALVSGEGGGGAKGGADEEEGKGAAGGGPALATSPPGKATGAAGSAGQGARGTGAGAGGSFSGPPPTAASNLRTVLGLLGRRVLLFQEYKRQFGMLLQGLLADPSTDKSVVLKILEIVQQWVHTELRYGVVRDWRATV